MASPRVAPARSPPHRPPTMLGATSSSKMSGTTPPVVDAPKPPKRFLHRHAKALLMLLLAGVTALTVTNVEDAEAERETPSGWIVSADAGISCGALLALAVTWTWAPRAVARAAAPLGMALLGTAPLVLSGAALGFRDAEVDTQMRMLSVVLIFPALFRMPMVLFVPAAAAPVSVAIAMSIIAGGQPSSIYFFAVVLLVFAMTAFVLIRNWGSSAEARATTARLEAENRVVHALLTRLIPETFVADLKTGRRVVSTASRATVLFAEVMTHVGGAAASGGPRKLSERATPASLVALSGVIELLDAVVEHWAVYKVETIGSEYMVVSGLPAACTQPRNTALRMLRVGIAMIEVVRSSSIEHVQLQAGMECGPVVETILGRRLLPRWKLFGDTVNTASRMKKHGAPNRLNVGSKAMHECYARGDGRPDSSSDAGASVTLEGPPLAEPGADDTSSVIGFRAFGAHIIRREPVQVKGKGMLEMFWVDPVRPAAAADSADSSGTRWGDGEGAAPIARTIGVPSEAIAPPDGPARGGRMFDVSYRVRKTESRELKSPAQNARFLMSPTHRSVGGATAEAHERKPGASRREFRSPKQDTYRVLSQTPHMTRGDNTDAGADKPPAAQQLHHAADAHSLSLVSSAVSAAGATRHGRNHASNRLGPARKPARPWWSASEIIGAARAEAPPVKVIAGDGDADEDIFMNVQDVTYETFVATMSSLTLEFDDHEVEISFITSIGATANFEFAMIAVNAGSLLCFSVMRDSNIEEVAIRVCAAAVAVIIILLRRHFGDKQILRRLSRAQLGGLMTIAVCYEAYYRAQASIPIYYPAMYMLCNVTAPRAMNWTFFEQLRHVVVGFVFFVVFANLGGVPDAQSMCVWVFVATVLPLIRMRLHERKQRSVFAENEATRASQRRSVELVHAMLPPHITRAMRDGIQTVPEQRTVALLTTDIVGFTALSAAIGADEVVQMLDELYFSFDVIVMYHKCYKVETIGDAFIACAGAPEQIEIGVAAARISAAAVRMMTVVNAYRTPKTTREISIRVGMHVGRVLGAVVGTTLPRYQLFGASMDFVQSMEQSSDPGGVHLSAEFCGVLRACGTYDLVGKEMPDGSAFLALTVAPDAESV